MGFCRSLGIPHHLTEVLRIHSVKNFLEMCSSSQSANQNIVSELIILNEDSVVAKSSGKSLKNCLNTAIGRNRDKTFGHGNGTHGIMP